MNTVHVAWQLGKQMSNPADFVANTEKKDQQLFLDIRNIHTVTNDVRR